MNNPVPGLVSARTWSKQASQYKESNTSSKQPPGGDPEGEIAEVLG